MDLVLSPLLFDNQQSKINTLSGHGLLCKTRPASPLAPKLKDEYHKDVLV